MSHRKGFVRKCKSPDAFVTNAATSSSCIPDTSQATCLLGGEMGERAAPVLGRWSFRRLPFMESVFSVLNHRISWRRGAERQAQAEDDGGEEAPWRRKQGRQERMHCEGQLLQQPARPVDFRKSWRRTGTGRGREGREKRGGWEVEERSPRKRN